MRLISGLALLNHGLSALAIDIDLNPNLFTIGPFTLTWHGVFSVLGILAGIRLGIYLAGKDGIQPEKIYDASYWAIIFGLLGARLYFVLENYRLFIGQWIRVLYVNEGGISQWGGIFGALVGFWLWSRRTRNSFLKIVDAAGPANLAGLAVGRIGDIINGEHHGTITTLPWGVRYVNAHTLGQPDRVVHPEVAYELIVNFILLGALLPFHQRMKRRLPDGVTGLIYLALYAVTRFFLSFLRDDQVADGLRQAQWASLIMVVVAIVAIPILMARRSPTVEPPAPAALAVPAIVAAAEFADPVIAAEDAEIAAAAERPRPVRRSAPRAPEPPPGPPLPKPVRRSTPRAAPAPGAEPPKRVARKRGPRPEPPTPGEAPPPKP